MACEPVCGAFHWWLIDAGMPSAREHRDALASLVKSGSRTWAWEQENQTHSPRVWASLPDSWFLLWHSLMMNCHLEAGEEITYFFWSLLLDRVASQQLRSKWEPPRFLIRNLNISLSSSINDLPLSSLKFCKIKHVEVMLLSSWVRKQIWVSKNLVCRSVWWQKTSLAFKMATLWSFVNQFWTLKCHLSPYNFQIFLLFSYPLLCPNWRMTVIFF